MHESETKLDHPDSDKEWANWYKAWRLPMDAHEFYEWRTDERLHLRIWYYQARAFYESIQKKGVSFLKQQSNLINAVAMTCPSELTKFEISTPYDEARKKYEKLIRNFWDKNRMGVSNKKRRQIERKLRKEAGLKRGVPTYKQRQDIGIIRSLLYYELLKKRGLASTYRLWVHLSQYLKTNQPTPKDKKSAKELFVEDMKKLGLNPYDTLRSLASRGVNYAPNTIRVQTKRIGPISNKQFNELKDKALSVLKKLEEVFT